ncbi:NAD(P)/FAD-dependent oxidoreductase [Sphingobacteriaceae bacterium WQ 2009]|uniref:NAD(P)/FAD-dependent oxidoreductase n=1 Tax=Rhinopithecimicrobium faecis TaxID=2820698 RepID=A0A8T4HAU2_9SPHI|nr:NAD(P)/FAD-dependent oxidoreductase [Sphingobacteriaceae bacterium WQ 2009]
MPNNLKEYDALVVGSGPNGFAAAITLQQQGLRTLLIEGAETIGGGMRTKPLTLPGFQHDVCSAIHPMAMASPFFASLPLAAFGLSFTYAKYEAAHPLIGQETAFLQRDIYQTASSLGVDRQTYLDLIEPVSQHWEALAKDTLGPLHFPENPLLLAQFGIKALLPAGRLAQRFKTPQGRALWAGMAAHGIQPLSNYTTSAIAMVLLGVGHRYGWPIPVGGSQAIADALAAYYKSLGGEIQTDTWVHDIRALPKHKILLLDLTPKQLLNMQGLELSESYKRQLSRYRQGMGIFKVDWALSEPVPFKDARCQHAGTVHLGNTFEEIAENEYRTAQGQLVKYPYVLFAQQSNFDPSRAPLGQHTGWAYCHVPNGSTADRREAIENQIERFAPGFKDTIRAAATMNTREVEAYNPNYVGGDINGGVMDIHQLYTRPTWSFTPYRTSNNHVYIASSATPPGGGVHGMCGFHAAKTALKDHYPNLSTI